ncbi:MAG TPA: NAD(P)-dependent oxidoreductase [Thermoanaerobaculia bacterium]|nr:NAD(P)-dependent oxidoreductase [Thermoanaerobaculia bacterium]
MRVFLAGATGAVGKRLVPMLVAKGHSVVGMTHSAGKAGALRAAGAEPVVADGLDRAAVFDAVTRARPDAVIHQMTSLARLRSFRRFDEDFALTNRLRTEGTDHLLEGARAAGALRFVAQSYGNWIYEKTGSAPKTEEEPLDPDPPVHQRKSLDAIRYLERVVTDAPGLTGIALRYGSLYGPGNGMGRGGVLMDLLRKRQFPVVGDGGGIWSFLHIDGAASANARALERGERGVYNVCDDDPAPVAVWLPELARDVGAPPPRRIPAWLARLAIGDVGVSMMTRIRGMSNAKAKRQLGWTPQWPSWREGFREGLG